MPVLGSAPVPPLRPSWVSPSVWASDKASSLLPVPIRAFYDQWPQYNRRLAEVVGVMSDEELGRVLPLLTSIAPCGSSDLPVRDELEMKLFDCLDASDAV